MPTDLTVYLDDRPGQLATVARALADAGVNIEGYFGLVVGGQGIMHVAVDDEAAAMRALSAADFEVREPQEVLAVDCEDRPGALAERVEALSRTGVNVTVSYLGTGTRIIVGAEDLEAARAAL